MADHVLFISWNTPVRGAEQRGLEVFNETLALYGRMQQEGRIERFEVMLFEPNTQINGCIQIFGSAEQLAALTKAIPPNAARGERYPAAAMEHLDSER